jgi:hypothetical protein
VLERWLVGKPAEPDEALPQDGPLAEEAHSRGMVVALDAEGQVLVVDRLLQGLYRVDPRTLEQTPLLKNRAWGLAGFQPIDAMSFGNELFVAGLAAPDATTTSLVAVAPRATPAGAGKPILKALKGGLPRDTPFAFTPSGHLAVCDPENHQIRFITNALARPGEATQPDPMGPGFKSALEQELERALAGRRESEAEAAGPQERKALPVEWKATSRAAPEPSAPGTHEAQQDPSGFIPVLSHRAKRLLAEQGRARHGQSSSRHGSGPVLAVPAGLPPAWDEPWPALVPGAPIAVPIPVPTAVPIPVPLAAQAPIPTPAAATVLEAEGPRFAPCLNGQQERVAGLLAAWAAEGFETWFRNWAFQCRLIRQHPAPIPALIRSSDRRGPLDPPAALPARQDRLALSPEAIQQVLQWMLRQAGRANPPQEVWQWLRQDAKTRPRCSFGLFQDRLHPDEFVLEIHHLASFAWAIDRSPQGADLLRDQLAAQDGIVGVCRGPDNRAAFRYGLKVVFRNDGRNILAILPGGRKRAQHVWSPGPPSAAEAPVQPERYDLNPLAREFNPE